MKSSTSGVQERPELSADCFRCGLGKDNDGKGRRETAISKNKKDFELRVRVELEARRRGLEQAAPHIVPRPSVSHIEGASRGDRERQHGPYAQNQDSGEGPVYSKERERGTPHKRAYQTSGHRKGRIVTSPR